MTDQLSASVGCMVYVLHVLKTLRKRMSKFLRHIIQVNDNTDSCHFLQTFSRDAFYWSSFPTVSDLLSQLICESFISLPCHRVNMLCQTFSLPSANLNHGVCFFSSNPTPGILINRPNGTDVYKGVPKDYTGEVSASVQIFIPESKWKHGSVFWGAVDRTGSEFLVFKPPLCCSLWHRMWPLKISWLCWRVIRQKSVVALEKWWRGKWRRKRKRPRIELRQLVYLDIVVYVVSPCLGSGPNDHVFVYFTDHGAPGILAFPNDDVSIFYVLILLMFMPELTVPDKGPSFFS